MISVRWRPSSWMQFSSPFFFKKIFHDTGQQLTIVRTNFLTDGFLQIIQRTGFVSVNTRFQIPPKEKITRWKIGRARGPTACLRNWKWGARETCFEQWSLTKSPLLLKWPTQRKRMPTTSSSPRPTYWILPIQKISGSRGSLCRMTY